MENQEQPNFEGVPMNNAFFSDQTSSMVGEFSQRSTGNFENIDLSNPGFENQLANNLTHQTQLINQNLESANNEVPMSSNNTFQENQGQTNMNFNPLQSAHLEAGGEDMQEKMEEDAPTSDTSDEDFRKEMELMMGSDDEDHEKDGETKFKTKNEVITKDLVINIDETLEERYKRLKIDCNQINNLIPVGRIEFILNEYIVVQSQAQNVLDLESLLFTQNKIPLGTIDDVFGQVDIPHYSVINDTFLKKQVIDKEIKIGDVVYYDTVFSKILPASQIEVLKKKKGCDASNRFDEEALQGEEVEFSDDEKEEEFSRNKRPPNKNLNNKEKKKYLKNQAKGQRMESNIVYNQGMPYVQFPNNHMHPPQQQQPYPMNQFSHMNQFPMGVQGMHNQMPMQMPLQNMPLFFNPMMGQNMNHQAPMPMQGYGGYQPQQVYMPNNNMFPNQPHNM